MSDKRIKWNSKFRITKKDVQHNWIDAPEGVLRDAPRVKTRYEVLSLLYARCPQDALLTILGFDEDEWNRVKRAAKRLGIVREVHDDPDSDIPPPVLIERKWPDPPVFEISDESWDKPGVRVGALSRIDWKDRGARSGLVQLAFEKVFVPSGCKYVVLNAGLVNGKDIDERVQKTLDELLPAQKREYKREVREYVLQEIVNELASIIPVVKVPTSSRSTQGFDFMRTYISTSSRVDKADGERIAELLWAKRPDDFSLLSPGGDRTRLKGVGLTAEEKSVGKLIAWLNPKKSRLPGKYASTAIDKEIEEDLAVARTLPFIAGVGGQGVSMCKPGGGEKRIPYFSLPSCCLPSSRRPGDPAVAMNQIGVRVIEISPDSKDISFKTWSFNDLAYAERSYVTGIKDGATELHRKIVETIREDDSLRGLRIGELVGRLEGIPREKIERALEFLVEPRASRRITWPGIYKDVESGRFNFHLDWFQERLRYPWAYDEDYTELRRILFGCMHAGYTTTDYEYIRHRLPELILQKDIQVMEILGDIIAGLKHGLMHRGQIIGNMNYTDQETFAGELVGTVMYDVFTKRFDARYGSKTNWTQEELESAISDSLILLVYITGNHDGWQKDLGVSPGVVFRAALLNVLNRNIAKFLEQGGLFIPNLDSLIRQRVIKPPGHRPVYTFPGGISTTLLHPSMARTQTISIRCEEGLGFSRSHYADIANFHTALAIEKWDPEFGQREATQAGCMLLQTDFEDGKMKRVDFGPVLKVTRSKNGRIFFTDTQFDNHPMLTEPISRSTDIDELKNRLKLLKVDPSFND